jgi:hypothetical protein
MPIALVFSITRYIFCVTDVLLGGFIMIFVLPRCVAAKCIRDKRVVYVRSIAVLWERESRM